MVWNVVELLNAFAEVWIIRIYFNKLMESKKVNVWLKALGFFIAAIVMAATSVLNIEPVFLLLITFLLLMTLTLLFYDEKLSLKLFYSFIYVVMILIADPILVGFSYLFQDISYSDMFQRGPTRVMGMVISKIMYFWMSFIIARVLTKKVKELPMKYWTNIFLTPVISVVILYGMTIPVLEHEDSSIIFIYIVSMIGIVYINLSIFDFFEGYSKQLKLAFLEKAAEREAENYRALKLSYREMKTLKHDFKNELDTLNKLISDRKYEDAEAHISELSDFIEGSAAVCYTGNEAVDSLINIKIRTAEQYEIKVITKMEIRTSLAPSPMELCRIFANALDNAIEACCKLKNEDKFICISIKEIDENMLIEISNSSGEADTSDLSSTKPHNGLHGYGVQSIYSSAARIGGMLSFQYYDGIFKMKLLVKNSDSISR